MLKPTAVVADAPNRVGAEATIRRSVPPSLLPTGWRLAAGGPARGQGHLGLVSLTERPGRRCRSAGRALLGLPSRSRCAVDGVARGGNDATWPAVTRRPWAAFLAVAEERLDLGDLQRGRPQAGRGTGRHSARGRAAA